MCGKHCVFVGRPPKDEKTKTKKEILGPSNFKNKAFLNLYVTLYPKLTDHGDKFFNYFRMSIKSLII